MRKRSHRIKKNPEYGVGFFIHSVFIIKRTLIYAEKDTIQDKDNERDPLISYFRTLEKEVPEADIEKRWNALMQNVNREPVSKRHRYLRIYMLAAGVAALFAGIAWGQKYIWIIIHIP